MTCSSVGPKMLIVRLPVPGNIPSPSACGIEAAVFAPECTFILLDPTLPDTEGTGRHGGGEMSLLPKNGAANFQQPTSHHCCQQLLIPQPQCIRNYCGCSWSASLLKPTWNCMVHTGCVGAVHGESMNVASSKFQMQDCKGTLASLAHCQQIHAA